MSEHYCQKLSKFWNKITIWYARRLLSGWVPVVLLLPDAPCMGSSSVLIPPERPKPDFSTSSCRHILYELVKGPVILWICHIATVTRVGRG